MKDYNELRNQFETREFEAQLSLIREAENINHPNQLSDYLDKRSEEFASKAMNLASVAIDSLELKKERDTQN